MLFFIKQRPRTLLVFIAFFLYFASQAFANSSVDILTPALRESISGTYLVKIKAFTDETPKPKIDQVVYTAASINTGAVSTYTVNNPSYPESTWSWDTTQLSNEEYILNVNVVFTTPKISSPSRNVIITINNPSTPPPSGSDLWANLAAGDTISGKKTVEIYHSNPSIVNKIKIWVDNNEVASTKGLSSSNPIYKWQWDTTQYANGQHTFKVKSYYTNGNIADKYEIDVDVKNVIPNQAPTISLTSKPSSPTTQADVLFSWQGNDSDGSIAYYYYALDSNTFTETTAASKTFYNLSFGSHTFKVKAKDDKGAESATETWTFTRDQPAKSKLYAPAYLPASGTEFDPGSQVNLKITGGIECVEGGVYQIWINGNGVDHKQYQYISASSSSTPAFNYVFNVPASSGTYDYQVVSQYRPHAISGPLDTLGINDLQQTDVYRIKVKKAPNKSPTATIISGPSGTINERSATFSWQGADPDGSVIGYYYALDNPAPSNWTTGTTANFNNLAFGSHTFYVKAKDNDGEYSNVASQSFRINNPPMVSITYPAANAFLMDLIPIDIKVNAADPEDTTVDVIKYLVDGQVKYQGNALAWKWDAASYAAGTHTIEAVGYDKNGLSSSAKVPITLTKYEKPQLTIDLPTTEACGFLIVNGTVNKIMDLNFYIDNKLVKTQEINPKNFSIELDVSKIKGAGSHELLIEAYDLLPANKVSLKKTVFIDNRAKLFLVNKLTNKIIADENSYPLLSKNSVEDYRLVFRAAKLGKINFWGKGIISFDLIKQAVGYEYACDLAANDFTWKKDEYRHTITVGYFLAEEGYAYEYPVSLNVRLVLFDISETEMLEVMEAIKTGLGATLDYIGEKQTEKKQIELLKQGIEKSLGNYNYKAKVISQGGGYYFELVAESKLGDGAYRLLMGENGAKFSKITAGLSKSFSYNNLLEALEAMQVPLTRLYIPIGQDRAIKTQKPVDYKQEIKSFPLRGASSADDAAEDGLVLLKRSRLSSMLKAFPSLVKGGSWILNAMEFIDAVNLISEGPSGRKEGLASLGKLIVGTGAVAVIGITSVPPAVVIGGGLIIGASTYYIIQEIGPGPSNKLDFEGYAGEKVKTTISIVNADKIAHNYQVSLTCDNNYGATCWATSPAKFTLPPGFFEDYINYEIWVTLPIVPYGPTEPPWPFPDPILVKLLVTMEADQYSPGYSRIKVARVKINKPMVILPNPSLYTCSYGASVEGCTFNISASNVSINWPNMNFTKDMDFTNLSVVSVKDSVEIEIPSFGDTKILADSPATINIANFHADYPIIKHNNVLIYDGKQGIWDKNIIKSVTWDEISHNLTYDVYHFDKYTILAGVLDKTSPIKPLVIAIPVGNAALLKASLKGQTEAGATLKVFINNALVSSEAVNSNGEFMLRDLILTPANNKLKLIAVDNAGNQSEEYVLDVPFIEKEYKFEEGDVSIKVKFPIGALPEDYIAKLRSLSSVELGQLNDKLSKGSLALFGLTLDFENQAAVDFNSPINIEISGLTALAKNNSSLKIWGEGVIDGANGLKIMDANNQNVNVGFSTLKSGNYIIYAGETTKPSISNLKVDNQAIVAGDYAKARPTITATAQDNSGGSGVGSWEVKVVDYVSNILVVSKQTTLAAPTTEAVSISYALTSDLNAGKYYIEVSATDVAGNTETAKSAYFEVGNSSQLGVSCLNAPNPFSPDGDGVNDTTKIGYQLSKAAKIRIIIASLNGEVLKQWEFAEGDINNGRAGYNEVAWDGKNQVGEISANGVYLCYLVAETGSEKNIKKLKLALLR